MSTEKLLLDKNEAARLLNISVRSVDNLRGAGELRSVKLGKRILFRLTDLQKFVQRDHKTKRVD